MPLSTDDVVAIQQLAARSCPAADAGDGEAFAAAFTEAGRFGAEQPITGRAALATFGASVPVRRPGVRHWLSNVYIDGDGDDATLWAYLRLTARTGPDGA